MGGSESHEHYHEEKVVYQVDAEAEQRREEELKKAENEMAYVKQWMEHVKQDMKKLQDGMNAISTKDRDQELTLGKLIAVHERSEKREGWKAEWYGLGPRMSFILNKGVLGVTLPWSSIAWNRYEAWEKSTRLRRYHDLCYLDVNDDPEAAEKKKELAQLEHKKLESMYGKDAVEQAKHRPGEEGWDPKFAWTFAGVGIMTNGFVAGYLVTQINDDFYAGGISLIAWGFFMGLLCIWTRNEKEFFKSTSQKVLDSFSVNVELITFSDDCPALFALAASLPALLAGFVAYWFHYSHHRIYCQADYTEDDSASICVNSTDLETQVCCRVLDQKTEVLVFMAFFAGNALAGWNAISFVLSVIVEVMKKQEEAESLTNIRTRRGSDIGVSPLVKSKSQKNNQVGPALE